MELVHIHNCKTGQVLLRPRTAQEQATVDTARAQAALIPPPVNELAEIKARLAALEAK
jgi:hypothetical protein